MKKKNRFSGQLLALWRVRKREWRNIKKESVLSGTDWEWFGEKWERERKTRHGYYEFVTHIYESTTTIDGSTTLNL